MQKPSVGDVRRCHPMFLSRWSPSPCSGAFDVTQQHVKNWCHLNVQRDFRTPTNEGQCSNPSLVRPPSLPRASVTFAYSALSYHSVQCFRKSHRTAFFQRCCLSRDDGVRDLTSTNSPTTPSKIVPTVRSVSECTCSSCVPRTFRVVSLCKPSPLSLLPSNRLLSFFVCQSTAVQKGGDKTSMHVLFIGITPHRIHAVPVE